MNSRYAETNALAFLCKILVLVRSSMKYEIESIGTVRNDRTEVEDDHWGDVQSILELDAGKFDRDALKGLESFSHLEVLFRMHRVDPMNVNTGARHPRNRPDWPLVGVFAQRVKSRPNLLGISRCELVEVNGLTIVVTGLDAIDGTPIIDIKPYLKEFGPRGEVRQPMWASELMKAYY